FIPRLLVSMDGRLDSKHRERPTGARHSGKRREVGRARTSVNDGYQQTALALGLVSPDATGKSSDWLDQGLLSEDLQCVLPLPRRPHHSKRLADVQAITPSPREMIGDKHRFA